MNSATPFRHKPDSLPGRSRQSAVTALPCDDAALCPHEGGPASPSAGPSIRDLIVDTFFMTGVTPEDMISHCREKRLSMARSIVCANARRQGFSVTHIGRHLGKRDHSTIITSSRNEARALAYFCLHPDFRLFAKHGDDMNNTRIPEAIRKAVQADFSAGMSAVDIAARHGIGKSSVWTICAGMPRNGKLAGMSRIGTIRALSDDHKNDLLRRYADGDSIDDIVDRFGLTISAHQIMKFASARGFHRKQAETAQEATPEPAPVVDVHPVLKSYDGHPPGSYGALAAFAKQCGLRMAGAMQLWHRERSYARD